MVIAAQKFLLYSWIQWPYPFDLDLRVFVFLFFFFNFVQNQDGSIEEFCTASQHCSLPAHQRLQKQTEGKACVDFLQSQTI